MTPEIAVVLLVATLAAMGSTLALLVTYECQVEEKLAAGSLEAADPDWDSSAWKWRLRMASLAEAYLY